MAEALALELDVFRNLFVSIAEDGTVTSVPSNIRVIGVTVTAQSANQGAYVTMSDRIRLRNR